MENFIVRLADLIVSISCNYKDTKTMCKNYLFEGKSNIEVGVTNKHILAEQVASNDAISPEYAEQLAVYRQIAEILPQFDGFVFHGAAITYRDKAILFTAPSGTGKSTHIRLWRKYLGHDVDIINGDKPILRLDGEIINVYGTPWCGKEAWGKNRHAPLSAICVIRQSKQNNITKLLPGDALTYIIRQTYLPKSGTSIERTLDLIDKTLKTTPVFMLDCDISEQAVKTSFEALTNEIYLPSK